jgi:hypothetical protein
MTREPPVGAQVVQTSNTQVMSIDYLQTGPSYLWDVGTSSRFQPRKSFQPNSWEMPSARSWQQINQMATFSLAQMTSFPAK